MRNTWRPLGRAVLGLALAAWAAPGGAQEFPARPIRMIVPFAAGGGTDILSRLFAGKLGGLLGQTVIVENRPGAGTLVGTRLVAQANPDGYTILTQANPLVTNALAYKSPGYRLADFAPVAGLTTSGLALAVSARLPATTLEEFITYARANPGKINAVSLGDATVSTIAYERFITAAGIKSTRINYNGSGPANQALASGTVDVHMDAVATAMAAAKAGHTRILATSFDQRLAQIPDVPTLKERGYPTMVVATWTGEFAPARTPEPVVQRLREDTSKVLAMPDVRERVEQAGYQAWPGRQQDFAKFLADDTALLEKDVRRLGLALDE